MCQKKGEGLRCHSHALQDKNKALQAYQDEASAENLEALSKATYAYNITPTAREERRDRGLALINKGEIDEGRALVEQADKYSDEREALLIKLGSTEADIEAGTDDVLPPKEGTTDYFLRQGLKGADIANADTSAVTAYLRDPTKIQIVSWERGEVDVWESNPEDAAERMWGQYGDNLAVSNFEDHYEVIKRTEEEDEEGYWGVEQETVGTFHAWPLSEAPNELLLSADVISHEWDENSDTGRAAVAWRLAETNSEIADAVLPQFAKSKDWNVRNAVASHSLTPIRTLADLANDEDKNVSGTALANPRLTQESLSNSMEPNGSLKGLPLSWLIKASAGK